MHPTNRLLRCMAWERAKGELGSMLQTFVHVAGSWQYENMKMAIDAFVQKVEEEGYQE